MLVVIDSHGLGHRAKHAMQGLSHNEKQTGVIYGFLRYVLKYAKVFNTKNFVFAWDSKKSFRADIYPEYKANRAPSNRNYTPDEQWLHQSALNQFYDLRKKVLPTLGFKNNFIQTGVEADDIIARVVRSVKEEQAITDIVVVSSDNDLWQLLEWCDILDPGKEKVLTKSKFKKEYGIHPEQWADVKALTGCNTDNVHGIEGVGEVKALQYIKGKLTKGKIFDRIQSHESQVVMNLNQRLVKLPHYKTSNFHVNFDEVFSLSRFELICEQYGFNSFLNMPMYNDWRKYFRMQ